MRVTFMCKRYVIGYFSILKLMEILIYKAERYREKKCLLLVI